MANRYEQIESEETQKAPPANRYEQIQGLEAPPGGFLIPPAPALPPGYSQGGPMPTTPPIAPAPPLPPISTEQAQPLPSYLQPPAKPDLGLGDVLPTAWKYSVQDFMKFIKGIKDTYRHPIDTVEALVNGVGQAPKVLRNAAGGVALNALSPDVRGMVVGNNPDLQAMSKSGDAIANAPADIHDYVTDRYGSGQKILNSLGYTPFTSASDLSTLLTLPTGLAGVTSAGAKFLAKKAGQGVLGEMMGATAKGADKIHTAMQLPAKIGDVVNPLNFVPDAPGNIVAGAGHAARGLGMERVGNFLVQGGNLAKPTKLVNNLAGAVLSRSISPESRVFMDAAGDQAQNVADSLEAAKNAPPGTSARAGQIVPGIVSTGPQSVATTVTSPRLQALGEAAQLNQDQAEALRLAQNKAARTGYIEREVSGTPEERADAERKQGAMRQRVFGISDSKHVTVDQDLLDLLNTPEGQAALTQINTNRGNRQLPPLGTGGYMQVGNALGGGTPQLVHLGGDTWIQLGDQLDGLTMSQIKKQLDDAKFRASGAAKPNSDNIRAIDDMSKKFMTWMDRPGYLPEYPLALKVDARLNREADQMNTGLGMQSRANDPAKFAAARDKVGTVKNPSVAADTGHQIHSRHEDYMLPEHLQAFDAISADHGRNALAAEHAGLAGDYRNEINEAFKPVHSVHGMGLKGHIAAMLFNKAVKGINPEVAANVSRSLMTPGGTLELANNALTEQAKIAKRKEQVNKLAERFRNTLIRNPTMYNIMENRRNNLADSMNQRLGDQ